MKQSSREILFISGLDIVDLSRGQITVKLLLLGTQISKHKATAASRFSLVGEYFSVISNRSHFLRS